MQANYDTQTGQRPLTAPREPGWMRRHWKTIAISAVTFVVGAALAAGGGSKTVTHTVTHTVTTPAPPAETITNTVTKTPASCKSALLAEARAADLLRQSSSIMSKQIQPAYVAGLAGGGVTAITTNMNRATAKVGKATAQIKKATPLAVDCLS